MVNISNQYSNEDGSVTVVLGNIDELIELVECINISNLEENEWW